MVKRILLVEDDLDDQSLFCESLTELYPAFICEIATDGPQAINMIMQNDLYDYIFIDLHLPKMDGFQLLELIRQEKPMRDVIIIILSSTNRQTEIDRGHRLGAARFFTKPSSFVQLLLIMKEAFGDSN